MRLIKAATILAASLSLVSTPVLAQTEVARAGAELVEPNYQDEGINADWIIPGLIVLGVVVTLGLIYLQDDDDEDLPTSP